MKFIKRKTVLAALIGSSIALLNACSSSNSETTVTDLSEQEFLAQRSALIAKYSTKDKVFATLQAQVKPGDSESAEYWRWRIDQYLYGQYPEYQPIYNTYKKGKGFHDIYEMRPEQLGPKKPLPDKLPALPADYFSDNLEGNPHAGWHDVVGNKIYITYQGELTDPYIASFDMVTKQWEGPYKAAESTLSKGDRKIDSHGRPIIEIDSKGHLHLIYGGHGGEREDGLNPMSIDTPHAGGRMLHVMSEKPYDISKFVYVDDITPFASYTASEKMANGDIFLFTRAGTHKSPWVYYKMPAGQSRFEKPVIFTWPVPQQHNPINVDTFYIKPLRVSDTEIAISSLWHECNFLEYHDKTTYARVNVYYMKLDTITGDFYNAQGEKLPLPITLDIANQKTLAFDTTQREETPFGTDPLLLKDGRPAVAYQARTKDYREMRMVSYNNGQWVHSQPMPGTTKRTLRDANNKEITKIVSLEALGDSKQSNNAVVVYKDAKGNSVFATATSSNGHDWQVDKDQFSLSKARIMMEAVKDKSGNTVAVVLSIRRGDAQRLYLWQDGALRGV
ncbi:BNR-4 repeat-containing protein [Catenovulum agarivorans]|uniref:BNR-4 repeat-containing protein n=1 Tax=Catenovulum agarivorans TaxID=1172192 RepID=UPI000305168E|nr:BNR-4 repeat-containing protein [Catenovulum agarivorans]